MASAHPPAKRQRRLVVLSSDEEIEEQKQIDSPAKSKELAETSSLALLSPTRHVALSSLPSHTEPDPSPSKRSYNPIRDQTTRTALTSKSPSASPTKKRIKKETASKTEVSPSKAKSLRNFFQPATEEQRWSKQRFNTKSISLQGPLPYHEVEDEEQDLIEDYEEESFNDIFARYITNEPPTVEQVTATAIGKATLEKNASSRPSRRFLLPKSTHAKTEHSSDSRSNGNPALSDDASRPWSERFAPCNLEELAVHKKKVADVQNWLIESFTGRSKRKLLVLCGPAGSGKTTTLSLLSLTVGFEIIEWRNPLGTGSISQERISQSAEFDDFLGRSRVFGTLQLDGVPDSSGRPQQRLSEPSLRRVILVEDFPASMNRTSSALSAFRISLHRCLASDKNFVGGRAAEASPPVVIILSETLLSTTSAISDNITVHRLLGPDISHHPGTTIMEFNSIAPTFMHKALDIVLKKEARISRRKRIPGPAVLKSISEMGDIRSAISSLEFMCLRGDDDADWGGRVAAKVRSIHRDGTPLTGMEKETLQMVTQREASLGIFHAVGKVVYNKRGRIEAEVNGRSDIVPPPEHLHHYQRPGGSQVSLESLISEIGTDISTFILALHENYVPSCDGSSFADCLDGCAGILSDSDILGPGSRSNFLRATRSGVGSTRNSHQGYGSSVDLLRQEDIMFQVAVRGLLFNLPYPVKRHIGATGRGSRASDAFKMFFPTSLRLWKETEELQGLIDLWARRSLCPHTLIIDANCNTSGSTENGVRSWRSREVGSGSVLEQNPIDDTKNRITTTMVSRHDLLLHILPYLSKLRNEKIETGELERLTQFHGIGGPSEEVLDEAQDDNETVPLNDGTTDQDFPARLDRVSRVTSRSVPTTILGLGLNHSLPVEASVEKLLLSDDDIEDD